MTLSERIAQAAAFVRARSTLRPSIAIVLGSGLGALAGEVVSDAAIPYTEIPGFPRATVEGHAGKLVLGRLEGKPVVVMQGRAHFYEGYTLQEVVFPLRVMKALGAGVLLVTNSAGGINRLWGRGDLMIIADHIHFVGANPLMGANDPALGPRFPDMTEAYSKELLAIAKKTARKQRLRLFEGVYAAVHGPSYETPAEIRALARLGADVVGMSTVPEVIAANHMGLRVLGISCVTNMAAGLSGKKINHDEVLEAGERVGKQFTRFLQALVPELARVAK